MIFYKKKTNTYYNSGAVLEFLLGIRRELKEKRPGLGVIGEQSWICHIYIYTAPKTYHFV
jgi:hypothetical protein